MSWNFEKEDINKRVNYLLYKYGNKKTAVKVQVEIIINLNNNHFIKSEYENKILIELIKST